MLMACSRQLTSKASRKYELPYERFLTFFDLFLISILLIINYVDGS